MQNLIDIKQLNKSYLVGEQPLQVLSQIDLAIAQGEYISIMGPSGSGKSTLLNMIGLLDRPDDGSYQLSNQQTTKLDEELRAELRRQHIGFIFQNFHLIDRLTAIENVELPLMLSGVSAQSRREKAMQLFTRLGIASRADHLPKQLSGGQMQRVAIARAMIMQPQILLADEPTGNLDQKSGLEVIDLLEELNTQGITLIVVTHDKNLGKRAHRHLKMIDGKIIKDLPNNQATTGETNA